MKTLQRVLAIVGGAFLIGTVQAVVFGPVTLEPANLTEGTGEVKGNPIRISEVPKEETAQDHDPLPGKPTELSKNGLTVAYTGTNTDPLLDAPVPEGSLTLRQAKELWDKSAYFIDARHEHEFEAGHIQYAAFLESKLFDTDIARANAVMDSIPVDGTIVLYCVGGECDASKNTAALLEQYGYSDLRIMGAGYEHWVAAGFETATGSDGGTP